jgi:hypothetical protein
LLRRNRKIGPLEITRFVRIDVQDFHRQSLRLRRIASLKKTLAFEAEEDWGQCITPPRV